MEIAGTVQPAPLDSRLAATGSFGSTSTSRSATWLSRRWFASCSSNSQLQWSCARSLNLVFAACYWPPAASATASAARISARRLVVFGAAESPGGLTTPPARC